MVVKERERMCCVREVWNRVGCEREKSVRREQRVRKGVNDVEGMRTRLREGKGPSEGKKW